MRCDWCHKPGADVVKLLDAVPVKACGRDHAEMALMGSTGGVANALQMRYNASVARYGTSPAIGAPTHEARPELNGIDYWQHAATVRKSTSSDAVGRSIVAQVVGIQASSKGKPLYVGPSLRTTIGLN